MNLLEQLQICDGRSTIQPIRSAVFFRRFSRRCQTFDDFFRDQPLARYNIGAALAEDTVFMNLLRYGITR